MVGKLDLDLGEDYAFDIRRAKFVAEQAAQGGGAGGGNISYSLVEPTGQPTQHMARLTGYAAAVALALSGTWAGTLMLILIRMCGTPCSSLTTPALIRITRLTLTTAQPSLVGLANEFPTA